MGIREKTILLTEILIVKNWSLLQEFTVDYMCLKRMATKLQRLYQFSRHCVVVLTLHAVRIFYITNWLK